METTERRFEILKILCRRRFEKISNLAFEFGVSERTIRRDIEFLSHTYPIYTQTGRYTGGVYVVDGYNIEKKYMSDTEIAVLKKLCYDQQDRNQLTPKEKRVFDSILLSYSKPIKKKGVKT